MRSRTVLIQARVSEKLIREVDKLVEEGYYKSRTEALEDAIRHLLERYKGVGVIGKLIAQYLSGKRIRFEKEPLDLVFGNEKVRSRVIEEYGTDDIDEIIGLVRRRKS